MTPDPKPIIAISMGDPAGIGPEVCLKLLMDSSIRGICVPLIFGDAAVLRRTADQLQLPMPGTVLPYLAEPPTAPAWQTSTEPAIVDFGLIEAEAFHPGRVQANTGRASYEYFVAAVRAALAGQVAAVTTGPINKESLAVADIRFPGHTEILAAETRSDQVCMMLTSDELSCCLVTTHVGYANVLPVLTTKRVAETIQLGARAMERLKTHPPRLVVCGLNPHAGEHGLFGHGEEERIIVPAIEIARQQGIQIEGPVPADTAFLPERRRRTDLYICMYHDQGLIPLKTLAFEVAVNVTLGLPIVRTSVDHGTAYDIAWQGRANATSLAEAVKLAARLWQPGGSTV